VSVTALVLFKRSWLLYSPSFSSLRRLSWSSMERVLKPFGSLFAFGEQPCCSPSQWHFEIRWLAEVGPYL
jgi:hypothetical protein